MRFAQQAKPRFFMRHTVVYRPNNLSGLSEKSQRVQVMFDRIAERYDLLNRLLSARQDVRWRKALVAQLPAQPDRQGVLVDIACGTGDVMLAVARRRNDYAELRGYDISFEMLRRGESRPELGKWVRKRNMRCSFTQASAEAMPVDSNSAHAVTISFGLRNVDNREQALREMFRILKSGGRVLVLEFFQPHSTIFAKVFDFYFKSVLPRVGGLISDRDAYQYLPASVGTMPSAEAFAQTLRSIGFINVKQQMWLSGATRLFVADKP
ncbi:MAG: bifunctional demethylmenaquinone methyltransferase/2-methoxy-6-polyprenyl-1,4-benzoquinol methylase UbiE [Proteobacteria bacterium]|nr:bifunctional demethylmenaquinone methyltransferase/2-methoxy-6-polyprenyl-1,4-benzoquinol methylase UbiE [Pseudomonadota bacterium]